MKYKKYAIAVDVTERYTGYIFAPAELSEEEANEYIQERLDEVEIDWSSSYVLDEDYATTATPVD